MIHIHDLKVLNTSNYHKIVPQKKKYIYYEQFEHKWKQRGYKILKTLRSIKFLRVLYLDFFTILPRIGITFYTKMPPRLEIEPTNYCNLNCLYCSRQQSSREKGYMKFDLFKKIIDDASQIGVLGIDLYLLGESLLHPQFVEMISYIKSKDLRVNVVTNGMLFDREKIEAILQSGLNITDNITFSIYGYSKEVNERLMKGVNHDKVLKNIHDFLKLRKKYNGKGPSIETIFYPVPENENETDQYVKYWYGIVDRVIVRRISKSFANLKKEEKNITMPRRKNCWILWNRLTIFWNGDVTFCGCDIDGDYVLDNLKEKSIKEIWNSKQLLSIKKLHDKKQFQKNPICSNCDM